MRCFIINCTTGRKKKQMNKSVIGRGVVPEYLRNKHSPVVLIEAFFLTGCLNVDKPLF